MLDRPYRDDLLRLFATNKRADVGGLPAFRQLLAQFEGHPFFNEDVERIRKAKGSIEGRLHRPDRPLTQQESVREAIQLLIKNRRGVPREPEYLPTLHKLIEFGYRRFWTPTQQQ